MVLLPRPLCRISGGLTDHDCCTLVPRIKGADALPFLEEPLPVFVSHQAEGLQILAGRGKENERKPQVKPESGTPPQVPAKPLPPPPFLALPSSSQDPWGAPVSVHQFGQTDQETMIPKYSCEILSCDYQVNRAALPGSL